MSNPLTASGVVDGRISVSLEPQEWQSLLITLRARQDDIKKVTPDYPRSYYDNCKALDVRLEQLKMKIVGQL